MKRWWLMCVMIVMVLIAGCASKATVGTAQPESMAPSLPRQGQTADAVAGGNAAAPTGDMRMVIYNASLALIVPDAVQTQRAIGQLMDQLGGYIESSESYNYGENRITVKMVLRVPAEQFNKAMDALRSMATEVQHDTVSTEDVGQEYVDLESRLRALELRAEKLEEFLTKAEDTEAVLRVYNELSATQVEIEQVKGRMRYLERQVAMATITVSLTPDELAQPIELPGWHPEGTAKRALALLVRTLQGMVNVLIWLVLYLLPIFALLGAAGYGCVRLVIFIYHRLKPQKK